VKRITVVCVLAAVGMAIMCFAVGCSSGGGSNLWGVKFDASGFVAGVDNPFFPLPVGRTLSYEGHGEESEETGEVFVTANTRQILGVTCMVVRDRVWEDGDLIEETFDWFAQDGDGNVWYFGEDSTEYDNGVPVSTEGSWEAGVDGAQPGIVMPADPRVGQRYRQEYYKGEAEDMGEVLSLTALVSVACDAFVDCVKTKDWSALEPGVVEHKYYAEGIGVILEVGVEGTSGRMELVDVTP
jgi:hypothetical protein